MNEENKHELDKIFLDGNEDDLEKITKPERKDIQKKKFNFWQGLVILILLGVICFLFWSDYQKKNNSEVMTWYAVKLTSGEVFYGEIDDTRADPVVMYNTYYNYDQDKEVGAGGELRLVKRGKEIQGGSGMMRVVRSQVLYMEPMEEGSKVLEAIRGYEGQ